MLNFNPLKCYAGAQSIVDHPVLEESASPQVCSSRALHFAQPQRNKVHCSSTHTTQVYIYKICHARNWHKNVLYYSRRLLVSNVGQQSALPTEFAHN
jgi:hypothetical protein